ncbi:MAG: peptidase T [Erysipelotrichaceae bacterium]|nr:peptidase T [Erysipelotrichaceae bacterium]
MSIEQQFLKYISYDTQSDATSDTVPSTSKQLNLAKLLVKELQQYHINAFLDKYGIVYATIPSNNHHQGDIIGFIAHMDTSPDCSGKNVNPIIVRDYQGDVITINKEKQMVLDPKVFPDLLNVIHHDLIHTDGNTLLGADDKAGIAIIMELVQYICEHPEFQHNDIQIAFTSDEEIGRGTDYFNLDYFKADYAYTVDGGDIHLIEYENFNAYSAIVEITGKSIHPGSAKNKMINSITISQEFDRLLPTFARPEYTEGYEGFNHLLQIHGNCEKTVMEYIIRNHDLNLAHQQCQDFKNIAAFLNKKYSYPMIKITIEETYLNMKEHMINHMYIIDNYKKAQLACNIDGFSSPIRGGTDGAMLTYKGLPCPNIGTGGYNYHGPYEYVSISMMQKQVEIILKLLELNTEE